MAKARRKKVGGYSSRRFVVCVRVCEFTFWAVHGKNAIIKVHALQEDGGVRIVHVVCSSRMRTRWTDDMAMREQKKERERERETARET